MELHSVSVRLFLQSVLVFCDSHYCMELDGVFGYGCFRQAYFDAKSGELVLDNRMIARNYMRGWFWVDCVS